MTSEILIGIGGLILSVLTYFAGVYRTAKRLSKDDRNARIQRVFEKYIAFRRTNYTSGFDGLQKAGTATLESDDEIRELIALIIKHGESNPLGGKASLFDRVDLKRFFDYAANKQINFFNTTVEEVLAKSQGEA
jgi:hypothetical protein